MENSVPHHALTDDQLFRLQRLGKSLSLFSALAISDKTGTAQDGLPEITREELGETMALYSDYLNNIIEDLPVCSAKQA